MITKIIACADIHFRNLERLDELQSVLEKFLEECREIVKQNGKDETRIVVCGDLVESKINISNECTLALGWFLRELNEICKTFVVAGNHDAVLSNLQRVDSLTPLFQIGNYENITFIDAKLEYESGCLVDDNVTWCLYSMFSDFNKPDIEENKILYPNNKFVGLIHADVNGAVNFAGRSTERGLDPNIFDGLDFVVAGHIHKRQEIKKNGVKIVYCSSIYQKDYGETVTGHGYVLWDVENSSYVYKEVSNEDYGFYKFTINDPNDIKDDKEDLTNY